jgi:hypothetical protein
MTRYAKGTTVPVDRSKAEIERALMKYGASKFGYFNEGDRAAIAFQYGNKAIRMRLPLPKPDDFMRTEKNRGRPLSARIVECERATKQRWRALLLIVKAKLEAIESGVSTFETEWMAFMVLPNGKTVAEELLPKIEEASETGRMPLLSMDPS